MFLNSLLIELQQYHHSILNNFHETKQSFCIITKFQNECLQVPIARLQEIARGKPHDLMQSISDLAFHLEKHTAKHGSPNLSWFLFSVEKNETFTNYPVHMVMTVFEEFSSSQKSNMDL